MIYQDNEGNSRASFSFEEELTGTTNEELIRLIIDTCKAKKAYNIKLEDDQIGHGAYIITEINSIDEEVTLIPKDQLEMACEIHEGSEFWFAGYYDDIEGILVKIAELPRNTLIAILEMLELNVLQFSLR